MSSVAVAMRHESCCFSCQVADQEACRLFGLAHCAFKTFFSFYLNSRSSLSLIAAYLVCSQRSIFLTEYCFPFSVPSNASEGSK